MLSRVAAQLYWMSHYLERAQKMARFWMSASRWPCCPRKTGRAKRRRLRWSRW